MDSDRKLIDGTILRGQVHRMLERSKHDRIELEFDKGFRYALSRVERLIDKQLGKKEETKA